jgi:hypothetical protein
MGAMINVAATGVRLEFTQMGKKAAHIVSVATGKLLLHMAHTGKDGAIMEIERRVVTRAMGVAFFSHQLRGG